MITTLNNKPDVLSYAQTGNFIMYGAGQVGITLLRFFADNDLIDSVLSFAVSDVTTEPGEIMGVQVYWAAELPVDSRVLIATHPKFHDEITTTLAKHGITDITDVSWDCYLQIRRTIHDFSTELFMRRNLIGNMNRLLQEITRLPEIIAAHTAAFAEYENAFEGRDVVLLGTGPSLNKYKPIDGAIHIGVNRAYKFDKVKLDFLFACDFNPYTITEMYGETGLQDYIDDLKKLDCKKFIGNSLIDTIIQLPEKYFKEINAVKYFLASRQSKHMYSNIKNHPLADLGSIIFSAMNFALFCHPAKIFIVGCDGYNPNSLSHFDKHEEFKGVWLPRGYTKKDWISDTMNRMIIGWEKVKKFSQIHYPDIEIISINPGQLRGLFKDMEM